MTLLHRQTRVLFGRSFDSTGVTFDSLPILTSFVLVHLDATPLVSNGAGKAIGDRVTGNMLYEGVGSWVTGSGRADGERGFCSRGVISNPLVLGLLLRAFVFLALGGFFLGGLLLNRLLLNRLLLNRLLLNGDLGRIRLRRAKSRRHANAPLTVVFAKIGIHKASLLDSQLSGCAAALGRSKVWS